MVGTIQVRASRHHTQSGLCSAIAVGCIGGTRREWVHNGLPSNSQEERSETHPWTDQMGPGGRHLRRCGSDGSAVSDSPGLCRIRTSPGRTYHQSSSHSSSDAAKRSVRTVRSGHRSELRYQESLDARRSSGAAGNAKQCLLRLGSRSRRNM